LHKPPSTMLVIKKVNVEDKGTIDGYEIEHGLSQIF
jgi:hypothetical protein